MRDTRSFKIKKILRKAYPKAKFRVRIEKGSLSEAIYVKTDLIHHNGLFENDKTLEIKKIIIKYQHVAIDEFGEILGGGNTFLFIMKL